MAGLYRAVDKVQSVVDNSGRRRSSVGMVVVGNTARSLEGAGGSRH